MEVAVWFIFLGLLFLFISVSNTWLERAPLTTSLIYLTLGIAIGPFGLGLLKLNIIENSKLMEHLTEIAVIISLFNAGLKLRLPFNHPNWRLPVGLAFGSMIINVVLIAVASHYLLRFNWGEGLLLGAILAPTDPVLASDVQVKHPNDYDKLRFSLTCEAGLNDGTAFPFVMLALSWMGLVGADKTLGEWIAIDLVWAVAGGLGTGFVIGMAMGWVEKRFTPKVKDAQILNDFLALALISLSYGIAVAIKAYGFLAVFVAGVMVRQLELKTSFWKIRSPFKKMSDNVLFFNEQFERLCEVAIVVILGAMLNLTHFTSEVLIIGGLLMFVIRPLSVFVIGVPMGESIKRLSFVSWFGIRGIGSIYYLAYAISHGISPKLAQTLTSITFSLIAISIIVHGLSVTPIMEKKSRWRV